MINNAVDTRRSRQLFFDYFWLLISRCNRPKLVRRELNTESEFWTPLSPSPAEWGINRRGYGIDFRNDLASRIYKLPEMWFDCSHGSWEIGDQSIVQSIIFYLKFTSILRVLISSFSHLELHQLPTETWTRFGLPEITIFSLVRTNHSLLAFVSICGSCGVSLER